LLRKEIVVFKVFLCIALVLSTSCIHTKSVEHLDVQVHPASVTQSHLDSQININKHIYLEEEYPLELFFQNLTAGKFDAAIKTLDLRYKPGTTANRALTQLMNAGIIPVYVRIENSSAETVSVSEANFSLEGDSQKLAAIPAAAVPREFTSLHGEAIAANAINVTLVVAATIVLLALLVGIQSAGGAPNFDYPSFSGSGSGSGSGGSQNDILNDTTLTKRINYRDYLLKEMKLPPGAIFEGLIFFRKGKEHFNGPLKLNYLPHSS